MKKFIPIVTAFALIICLTTTVYCSHEIQPLWDNTLSVYASINFLETEGTFVASVIGNSDVTDIYAMAYLYYKDSNGDWIEQTGWGALSNTHTLAMSRSFTGESGVEYKCDFTAYVYVGTDCEEITYTAYETCP